MSPKPPQPNNTATDIIAGAMRARALRLQMQGNAAAALAQYREILPLLPEDAALHFLAGTAALQSGDPVAAIALLDMAIAHRTDDPAAWVNRGIAHMLRGTCAQAEADFTHAITMAPEYAEARFDRGNLFLMQQNPDAALRDYNAAIALNPDYSDARYNRGGVLLSLERPGEALADFDAVLHLVPDHTGAMNNRGNALRAMHLEEAALTAYDRVLTLDPSSAEGHYNRAIVLTELARPEEAMQACQQALHLHPDYAEAHCCRGNILREMGRWHEAITAYDTAERLRPDYAEARWDRSLVELLLGDYTNGWAHFEERWNCALPQKVKRSFAQPLWNGEPIAGQTILLHAEQGFGDSIQFCRYAPLLAAQGATVLLQVPTPLVRLFSTLSGVTLLSDGAPLPAFDWHCPLMSLPRAFGTQLSTIPAATPYLKADPVRCAVWEKMLGPRTRPRIGLVWSGRPGLAPDRTRSMALATLAPLLAEPYEFHILQKEIRPADRPTLAELPLYAHTDELADYADTAALASVMDVVIAVDTSVAHLAGALDLPVWLMLPFAPDWRWLTGRQDSPWYPRARLFRQTEYGNWNTVVATITAALRNRFA